MRVPPAARILSALIVGLCAGYLAGPRTVVLPTMQVIGGLWLDALRMPIVPLVFALVVTGLGSGGDAGATGGLAWRAIGAFVIFLFGSALLGVVLGTTMFRGWTIPDASVLRIGGEKLPALPPLADTLRALVPVNPIASAAAGAIVPIVIFALLFALALRRIEPARAEAMTGFFRNLLDPLLVIIGWVLLAAPIGVFALSFDVAARSGFAVGALLAWYVAARVIAGVTLLGVFLLLIALASRTPLRAFVRAVLPAQSVAFSTQSSLASLPAMLQAVRTLALPEQAAGTMLPLAVALFRISAPCAITLVTLALARLNGIDLGAGQLVLMAMLAVLNNLVIAGLPNQISFFAAYAPVALAVGVPVELLPLFLAVDTIPDMFATAANVTADVAVTTLLTSPAGNEDAPAV